MSETLVEYDATSIDIGDGNERFTDEQHHHLQTTMAHQSLQHGGGALRRSASLYNPSFVSTLHSDEGYTRSERGAASTLHYRENWSAKAQTPMKRSLRPHKSMSALEYRPKYPPLHLANGGTSDHWPGPGWVSSGKGIDQRGSLRRLKSHSSLFFRSKHKRHESSKGSVRDVRDSSNDSGALSSGFSGQAVTALRPSGLRNTARRVSKTVKTKLSKLFGRGKASEDREGSEMAQHRVSGLEVDLESRPSREYTVPDGDACLSRVNSYVPSIHSAASHQKLRSRRGSLESNCLESLPTPDETSRVTSWTDSSANTIINYLANEDRERQRLSVINENGAHIPSTSNKLSDRVACATYVDSVGSPLCNQQVYSALIKRLVDAPADKDVAEAKPEPATPTPVMQAVPPRQSSLDRGCSRRKASRGKEATHVDEDVFGPEQEFQQATRRSDDVMQEAGSSATPNLSRRPSYKAYPNPTAGDGKGLSPLKMVSVAPRGGSSSEDDIRTMAGSPPGHLFRAASPYRRTLREHMIEYHEAEHTHALDTRYLSTLSGVSLPTRRPSTVGSEPDVRLTYAESFYSFTTEEMATDRLDQVVSPGNVHSTEPSDVTPESPQGEYPPLKEETCSPASSVEWKKWLSADIGKRERGRVPTRSPCNISTGQGSSRKLYSPVGHVREEAEIESPADAIKDGLGKAPLVGMSSLSPASQDAENVVPGRTRSRSRSRSQSQDAPKSPLSPLTSPLEAKENSSPTKDIAITPWQPGKKLQRPPIPSRNALRAMPSTPNIMPPTACERGGCSGIPKVKSLNSLPQKTPIKTGAALKSPNASKSQPASGAKKRSTRLGEASA